MKRRFQSYSRFPFATDLLGLYGKRHIYVLYSSARRNSGKTNKQIRAKKEANNPHPRKKETIVMQDTPLRKSFLLIRRAVFWLHTSSESSGVHQKEHDGLERSLPTRQSTSPSAWSSFDQQRFTILYTL